MFIGLTRIDILLLPRGIPHSHFLSADHVI